VADFVNDHGEQIEAILSVKAARSRRTYQARAKESCFQRVGRRGARKEIRLIGKRKLAEESLRAGRREFFVVFRRGIGVPVEFGIDFDVGVDGRVGRQAQGVFADIVVPVEVESVSSSPGNRRSQMALALWKWRFKITPLGSQPGFSSCGGSSPSSVYSILMVMPCTGHGVAAANSHAVMTPKQRARREREDRPMGTASTEHLRFMAWFLR
jgi:hypothetical protein